MVLLIVVLIRVNLKVRIFIRFILNQNIGLDEYNDVIYYKLLDQLIGKVTAPLNEPENPLHPCWTDLFDSQAAFDEAVMNLTQWYKRASDKIKNSDQYDIEARIRLTGTI